MVYSKLLEDGAVRPYEFKVYCEQCHEHHLAHNQDPQKIIYVTEDWELAKGSKSMESFVTGLKVRIRNTEVNLRHKFVHVPLVYSKETMSRDFQEMERERLARGTSPWPASPLTASWPTMLA